MIKLDEVFKNIDSKIFESDEVKTKLSEAFESAVNEKAELKAQEIFESKESDYTKALDETIEASVKSIELDLKEKFDSAVKTKVTEVTMEINTELEERFAKEHDAKIADIQEKSDKYLDLAVKEFVSQAQPVWESEIKVARAEKIIEEFSLIAEAFGVSMNKIDESDESKKLVESLDESIKREKSLQESLDNLTKDKMLKEAKTSLTSVQSDKLDKLIESVDFVNEESFKSKLGLYVGVVSNGDSMKVDEKVTDKSKLPWANK